MDELSLVELTKDNWERVAALEVNPGQEGFVAPNLKTIAETRFYPWSVCRVVQKGAEPIGLAAFGVDPDDNELWLFRFMIAGREQGKGFGREVLRRLIEEWREIPGVSRVVLSYEPGNAAAERLYVSFGFVPGEITEWGERMARLDFTGH